MVSLREIYEAALVGGFTERQALRLVAHIAIERVEKGG